MESLRIPKIEKKRKPFHFTARDFKVLEHLGKNRFATATQLYELFWPSNKSHCNHYRRLNELGEAGLITNLLGDGGNRLGYKLSREGYKLLARRGTFISTPLRKRVVFQSAFRHEKILGDLRQIFEKCELVSDYQLECEVRHALAIAYGLYQKPNEHYKVPDGIFYLSTAKGLLKVAIELELTQKSRLRYREIFRQLLTSKDFQIVLYIVENTSLKKTLETIYKEVKATDPLVKIQTKRPGFYFIELEILLRDQLHAIFACDDKSFSLASLSQALTATATP